MRKLIILLPLAAAIIVAVCLIAVHWAASSGQFDEKHKASSEPESPHYEREVAVAISAPDDVPLDPLADGDSAGGGRLDLLRYDASQPWRYKHDAAFQRLGRNLVARYQEAARAGTLNRSVRVGLVPVKPEAAGELFAALDELGFVGGIYQDTLGGELPLSALPEVAQLPQLRTARERMTKTNFGTEENESVQAMQVEALQALGYFGAGTRIGIVSDSFNELGEWEENVLAGDLPGPGNPDGYTQPVVVLKDDTSDSPRDEEDDDDPGDDEGRAMAQLVFDLAPEAEIYFHSGFNNAGALDGSIAVAIDALADAGCDIIVDDVEILTASVFQDAYAARSVKRITEADPMLIYASAASNNSDKGIQLTPSFAPDTLQFDENTSVQGLVLDWDPGPGIATRLIVDVTDEEFFRITLWWAQPYKTLSPDSAGAETDLDYYLIDPDTGLVVEGSSENNLITGDPFELDGFELNEGQYELVVTFEDGVVPTDLRMNIYDGIEFTETYGNDRPTIYGHPAAQGCLSVGAADFRMTPAFGVNPAIAEEFSGFGPVFILFDDEGNRLAEPVERLAPALVASEGNSTSVPDFKPFYGTSASSPNAAAALAVLRSAFPTLTRDELYQASFGTTLDMNTPGYDYKTGYGFMQPYQAAALLGLEATEEPFFQNTQAEDLLLSGSVEGRVGVLNLVAPVGTSFNGAVFTFSLSGNAQAGDELLAEDDIHFGYAVAFTGGQVTVDGVVVGTVSGSGADPLIIAITSDTISLQELNAVLASVKFINGNVDPAAGVRTILAELSLGGVAQELALQSRILPQTLLSWRRGYFTESELANSGLESTLWGLYADPDEDGQVNLAEYAFDTNPRSGASLGEVEFFLQTFDFTEATFPTGVFDAPAGRNDLLIAAESTTDLVTWSSDPFDVEFTDYATEEHPGFYDTNKAYMTQKPTAEGQLRAVRFTFEYVGE